MRGTFYNYCRSRFVNGMWATVNYLLETLKGFLKMQTLVTAEELAKNAGAHTLLPSLLLLHFPRLIRIPFIIFSHLVI